MAMGVTANTTVKITSQHGLLYDYLLNSFDFETAKRCLDSNEEAIKLVSQIIEKEKINCDFSYQNSSYAIGVELNQDVFDGMYISCNFPSYSFRNAIQANGKKLLIVGGLGEFSNFLPNMYIVIVYKKWDMTTSHVAAKIISDKILNIENSYEKIYTVKGLKPIKK